MKSFVTGRQILKEARSFGMLKILNLPSWAVSFMTHEQAMQTIIQPRFQHAFLKRMSEKIEAVVGVV